MASASESLRLVAELQRSADAPRRQALAAAYRRYFLRLIGLLRRRLPPHLCQRVDPDCTPRSLACPRHGRNPHYQGSRRVPNLRARSAVVKGRAGSVSDRSCVPSGR
jgi:hypothetical protein